MLPIIYSCFPTRCVLCRCTLATRRPLCAACEDDLPWLHQACFRCGLNLGDALLPGPSGPAKVCGQCLHHPPPFDRTVAGWHYQSPLTYLITKLKFQKQTCHGQLLGELMAAKILDIYRDQALPECIVPVPLHPRRVWTRGYNQAVLLAKPIAKALRIPLNLQCLQRTQHTPPQSRLPLKERHRNLRHAFTVTQPLSHKHVAIIDDVVTTGQTVTALSRQLRQQGVKKIDIWCCARTQKVSRTR